MNNLRRTLSLLLALVMLVALGAFASAEGNTEAEKAAVTLTDEDVAALSYLNGQLRVGMECAYAPNNWQESEASETNVPIENVPGAYAEGYDVQIARIIADQLGLELVVVKMDWDGLIEALNQGQIDAIIAGMADTESRKEAINFTAPYHETVYALMVNAGTKYEDATSLADFNGASVLGQKDTMLDTVIDEIPSVNHLTPVDSVPNQLSQLDQGTCDAITYNTENTNGFLRANPDLVAIQFEKGKGFKETVPANVGLAKGQKKVLAKINKAIAAVDQDTRTKMFDAAVERQPS